MALISCVIHPFQFQSRVTSETSKVGFEGQKLGHIGHGLLPPDLATRMLDLNLIYGLP